MGRFVYLGTPDVAVGPLRALVEAGHDIALVITRPDRRRGRGSGLDPSPVKRAALDLDLRVSHDLDQVKGAEAELGVVVAFGRLIPAPLLAELPMVNLHFSLLPRWRGAAPVERAILAGDNVTGVSVMALDEGLDTGPVYRAEPMAIGPGEHAASLRARLAEAGAGLLTDVLAGGAAGLPTPVVQAGVATYAGKIAPEDLRLDWAMPATELERVVRLDRAWTTFRGKRLRVLAASAVPGVSRSEPGFGSDSVPGVIGPGPTMVVTGDGLLILERVQPESGRPMSAGDWARGVRPVVGEPLGG